MQGSPTKSTILATKCHKFRASFVRYSKNKLQMLHKQTVSHSLLKILQNLMKEEILNDFVLVGGTSLALRYGHRDSEDIDMFTSIDMPKNLWKTLQTQPNRQLQYAGEYSIAFIEDEIKVDLAKWNMAFDNFETIEGIRIADPMDVFAMKFDAICTRKTKKDFIDILELCKHFSFHEGFSHFNKIYPYGKNSSIIFAAFGEIDVADNSKMPKMYIETDWEEVKTKLKKYAKRYFLNL